MDDIESRLTRCFQLIFPELSGEGARNATPDSVSGWDSIAAVTLVNLIEEEFDVQIGLEDIGHVVSFSAMLDYLQARAAKGGH